MEIALIILTDTDIYESNYTKWPHEFLPLVGDYLNPEDFEDFSDDKEMRHFVRNNVFKVADRTWTGTGLLIGLEKEKQNR
jgi:hypothetical protein